MAHFHGICHKNCILRYVEAFLDFSKLYFRDLKGQFDVKKTDFRGLIAKIGYLRPNLASRSHIWPIYMEYVMGIVL